MKSAAYVQTWEQARISEITFSIRPAQGWDARTNTYADSAKRSADVYVFCLLEGEDREHIDPLDVAQWTFYVLSTSELDRQVPTQKTIRLGRLKALGARASANTTSSRPPLMRRQRTIAAADFLVEFSLAVVASGPGASNTVHPCYAR